MHKLIALMSLISVGCTSTTIINSRPTGAEVSVDGQSLGEAPAQWSNTVWVGTENTVRLTKKGYKDTSAIIKADQWNTAKLVLSIICFWPTILVSTEYRPSYEFTLKPEGGDKSANVGNPWAPIRLATTAEQAANAAPAHQ